MTKNNSAFTPLQLGIGTGTVLLLSKWVASISTLALPESIINYGLIAGILYAMIGPFIGDFNKKNTFYIPRRRIHSRLLIL